MTSSTAWSGCSSRIYNMGFDTVESIFRYFLLGAVVVIPIWLIMRVLKMGRGTSVDRS